MICMDADTPAEVVTFLATLTPAQLEPLLGCCWGSAMDGPDGCTCWTIVYDLEQQPADLTACPDLQPQMCADCAYRPDSPERKGDDRQKCSEPGELDRIAERSVFWCHQGMRRVIAYQHPCGLRVEAEAIGYQPPIERPAVEVAIPFRADGQPGLMCAGWYARRAQLTAARS